MLPDPGTPFGARVVRRLRDESVAWLTIVDPAGRPQPAPVWFLWQPSHRSLLIYSHCEAKRLGHLEGNPRVALHLDGDGRGGDIVVLTGELRPSLDEPPVDRHDEYLAKYGERIVQGWQTAERFAAIYSVPLRLGPFAVRGH